MNGLSTLSAGDDYRGRDRQLRPGSDTAELAEGQEGHLPGQSYRRPHAEEGWHFLTGDPAVDQAS